MRKTGLTRNVDRCSLLHSLDETYTLSSNLACQVYVKLSVLAPSVERHAYPSRALLTTSRCHSSGDLRWTTRAPPLIPSAHVLTVPVRTHWSVAKPASPSPDPSFAKASLAYVPPFPRCHFVASARSSCCAHLPRDLGDRGR